MALKQTGTAYLMDLALPTPPGLFVIQFVVSQDTHALYSQNPMIPLRSVLNMVPTISPP